MKADARIYDLKTFGAPLPLFASPSTKTLTTMGEWLADLFQGQANLPAIILVSYDPIPKGSTLSSIPDLAHFTSEGGVIADEQPWCLSAAILDSDEAVSRAYSAIISPDEQEKGWVGAAIFSMNTTDQPADGRDLVESAIALCRRNPDQKLVKLHVMDGLGPFANLSPFQPSLNTQEQRVLDWLDADALRLEMQPIVAFNGVTENNFELLARFRQDDGSVLDAGKALDQCANARVFTALDSAVVDRVAKVVDDLGQSAFSINVDRSCLENPAWVEQLHQLIIHNPSLSRQMAIEITERGVAQDVTSTHRLLAKLRGWGLKVVIDDFGRGVTTLNEVASGQVDTVKFDRQVIEAAFKNPAAKRLLSEFVSTIKGIGCVTVAEGIETNETFRMAEFLGIDSFQGYFFGTEKPKII